MSAKQSFEGALNELGSLNDQASVIHEQNQEAASYQEVISDESFLELTMTGLAEQQTATTQELGKAVLDVAGLYKNVAVMHMELTDRLAQNQASKDERLASLEEDLKRVDANARIVMVRMPKLLTEVLAKSAEKKAAIDKDVERILAEDGEVIDELNRLAILYEIIGRPWPVPQIKRYKEISLREMAEKYASEEKTYLSGGEDEKEELGWEIAFTEQVDTAISELDAAGLLCSHDIPRKVITAKSTSNLLGTNTAFMRLHDAGIISKQRQSGDMMDAFELVANKLFNTNKKYLGEHAYQKRAMEIINVRLQRHFARQSTSD